METWILSSWAVIFWKGGKKKTGNAECSRVYRKLVSKRVNVLVTETERERGVVHISRSKREFGP